MSDSMRPIRSAKYAPVEDSHAKLAADMRDAGKPGHIFPEGMRHTSGLKTAMREWAARVEQLGQWAQAEKERVADNMQEVARQQMDAREAEIATVREEIIAKAGPEPSPGTVQLRIRGDAMRATKDDLLAWAARLGGTTT